jgi:hypothetical protein
VLYFLWGLERLKAGSVQIGIRYWRLCPDTGFNLPTGFNSDKRFGDEGAEEEENGVEQFAMQQIHREGDQNYVSTHRRRESLIHSE